MHAENICFISDEPESMSHELFLLNDREVIIFVKEDFYQDAMESFERNIGKKVKSTKVGNSVFFDIYHFEF